MDGIGKMYNPDSLADRGGMGGWRQPRTGDSSQRTSERPESRPLPEHTEKFYRTLREAARETAKEVGNTPAPDAQKCDSEAVFKTNQSNFQSNSGGLLGSLGSKLNGIPSLLKKLGEDDILLLLMIILLFGEDRKDDLPLLVILGILLLS